MQQTPACVSDSDWIFFFRLKSDDIRWIQFEKLILCLNSHNEWIFLSTACLRCIHSSSSVSVLSQLLTVHSVVALSLLYDRPLTLWPQIPESWRSYHGQGQMRHRWKRWLFFICGLSLPLSRPPFHQVTVCTFGRVNWFYWTSPQPHLTWALWLQMGLPLFLFSPLIPISLPFFFFSPFLIPRPFPEENDQHRVVEERAKDGEKD